MKRLFLLVLLVLCTMCGCTKLGEIDNDNQPEGTPTIALTPTPATELSEVEKYLLGKEKLTYVPDGDAHAYYFSLMYAPTEDGFFYMAKVNKGMAVYFYDFESKRSTRLCNRPDCKHNDTTCSALRAEGDYYMEAILYDSGRVYMMATTDEGGYLDSWAQDGSDYKRVAKLWEISTYMANYNEYFNRIAMIHRGYFYYAWSDDYDTYHIARVKTDGSTEVEELAAIRAVEPGEGAVGTLLYASGDNVYVLLYQTPSSGSIHKINIPTKETKVLYTSIGANRGIYVEDDKVYTINYDKLYRIDGLTGEETLLYELPYGGTFFMSSDGEYIYIDNDYIYSARDRRADLGEEEMLSLKRTIYVLDMEGNLVDELIMGEDDGYTFFGDRRYLFAMRREGNSAPKMMYFDKRLIGTGLYESESGLYKWEPVGY